MPYKKIIFAIGGYILITYKMRNILLLWYNFIKGLHFIAYWRVNMIKGISLVAGSENTKIALLAHK
jgi:hypothetical protein